MINPFSKFPKHFLRRLSAEAIKTLPDILFYGAVAVAIFPQSFILI